MMTKKDFIALADHIRIHNDNCEPLEYFDSQSLKILADFCASRNPRFNRKRWLDYIAGKCGPNGGMIK